jgi:alanine or glycine:cation symporter, AGCS family
MNIAHLDDVVNNWATPLGAKLMSVVFYSVPVWQEGEKTLALPLILVWLMAVGIFYSLYLGFINVRGFKHAFRILRGDYDDKQTQQGQLNRMQVLSTELAGTVGLGNIAGVAIAISVGGPGATLWMLISAFLGMSTKFAEAALGVRYRHVRADGRVFGGPMYYLRDGLRDLGWPILGKILATIFCVCMVLGAFGAGNLFQVNQVYNIVRDMSGGDAGFWADKAWLFGVITAIMTGAVILGGIKSIARVAEKIVPAMGVIYVLCGLIILGVHIEALPAALKAIWQSAFTLQAGWGGVLGALIMGVQRAAFSNEAGLGTAAIAHAPTATHEPVSEGFIGMLGPFFDTIIICTMTALVVVATGVYQTHGDVATGVVLTSRAFATVSPYMVWALFACVALFAYSTLLTYSYYGVQALNFLFGEKPLLAKIFNSLFLICCVIAPMATLGAVVDITDGLIFAMTVPNIIGLYLLAPKLKRELKTYWAKFV